MLSGRFITSEANSEERVLGSCAAGTIAIAMGDDCNETLNGQTREDVVSRYDSMGYEGVVDYELTPGVETAIFCSMRFYELCGRWSAEPVHWVRTLYRLLSKERGGVPWSEINQFQYEIRNLRQDVSKVLTMIHGEYAQKSLEAAGDT
jgi:hypothetical protein